jgi:hypothetical protein
VKLRSQGLIFAALPLLLAVCLWAAPRVPLRHLGLHRELNEAVENFDQKVSARWDGSRPDVVFAAELLTANSHRGQQLLSANALKGVELEVARLADLNTRGVTIAVNFPILYEPFHKWRGREGEYRQYLEVYRQVAARARARNLRLIVETGIVFPGVYSAQSGFDVAKYYKTLSDDEFRTAKSDFVNVVVRELQPDFVNLGAEPDTEVQITGKKITGSPEAFADLMNYYVGRARGASSRTMFAAGVGNWQRNGQEYVKALSRTKLDIIDIHVYPVNVNLLDNLISFTETAQSAGKRVGISEAWALKQGRREFLTINSVSNPAIFARDGFSFWAPLDQKFLGALVKFAAWKRLVYVSPFWSKYFFAYLDFDSAGRYKPEKMIEESTKASVDALIKGRVSETGEFWKCAVQYGPCLGGPAR